MWKWIRSKVNSFDQCLSSEDDLNLIHLCFSKTVYEKEILWLLSIYMHYAWDFCVVKEEVASLNSFHGYLTFKYRNFILKSGHYLRGMEDFK